MPYWGGEHPCLPRCGFRSVSALENFQVELSCARVRSFLRWQAGMLAASVRCIMPRMYCIKCGADNLETAKFCRKCGEAVVDAGMAGRSDAEIEEETRVAVRAVGEENHSVGEAPPPLLRKEGSLEASVGGDADTDAAEAEIFAISPTLLFVKIGYALAAFGALLLVAAVSVFTSVAAWIAVLIALLLFLIPAYYHFKQKIVKYTLTHSKLEIDEGFISRTTRNVPIRRIQDVTVSASVMQRLLGFGNLAIDNASDDGGKVVLKNINDPKYYADVLLRQMRRLDE